MTERVDAYRREPVQPLTDEETEEAETTCCVCGREKSRARRYVCASCTASSQGIADEQEVLNRELRRARLAVEEDFHLRDSL